MAERRYVIRLWRDRAGPVTSRVLAPKLVTGDVTDWLDLDDRASVSQKIARMVAEHGRGSTGGYWLEVADPVTGEQVARIEADEHDPRLSAVLTGTPALSLEDVSDEMLVRELSRRLARRLAAR